MKLTDYFKAFLTDTVNLRPAKLTTLEERVETITGVLEASTQLTGRVRDTIPQGSWAHETIIEPGDGLEFDADFLLHIEEDPDWTADPKKYANAVFDALSSHGTYSSKTTRKNRCVRVTYANDSHIDIVPYVILSDDRQVIVNRTTNTFEDTNPSGFSDWLREKDELTNRNLRKVLRLLKYLRDHQNAFDLKSVLLTTMVGNIVEQWQTAGDPDHYKDVSTTLVHLVEALDAWLQSCWTKPTLLDPSCPSTSFDHRWTDPQFEAFKDKVHKLAPKLRAAYDTVGVPDSIIAWQDVFGPSFPSSLQSRAAATASAGPIEPYDPRGPEEQMIEERFPVRISGSVRIECQVSEPTYVNRRQRRLAEKRTRLSSRLGRVPRQRDLEFKFIDTDVAQPYQLYWKVKNRGPEAERRRELRGQIVADDGSRRRKETSDFVGNHYVECYIVKDGVCVARTREPVIIT